MKTLTLKDILLHFNLWSSIGGSDLYENIKFYIADHRGKTLHTVLPYEIENPRFELFICEGDEQQQLESIKKHYQGFDIHENIQDLGSE